ncbi:MAG: hypothetical protein CVU52_07115 [Deltaproteobacteria bacterium HGW-Deltaproteobacteria-10]|nr:MAG: hypothetical protein CVU52_07115 [Deltaproteobacteria bacterium HGW-Deltaproteobacteria-10]
MPENSVLEERIAKLTDMISHYQDVEASLRESRDINATILQKSFAAIYVVQDGKFCTVNIKAAANSGYTTDELIGMNADSIVHPEDKANVLRRARAMLRGKSTKPYAFRILTKQGDVRWIMETVSAITYDGHPAILGNSMDITEHRQAIEKLQDSEILYRTIFETTLAATIIIEEDTTISLVNSAFSRMSGYSRKELEGKKSWAEFVIPEDRERMKAYHYLRRKDNNAAPKHYECSFINRQGDIRNVILMADMIPHTNKSVASFIDITDHKLAVARIEESKKLYRTIFENTGTATIIIEEDTTVSLVNSVFVNMSGYSREDLEGKRSWTEFIFPDDLERMITYHNLRRLNHLDAPRNYEFRFIDVRGSIRNVFVTIDMIPGTKKSVASLADITEQKLAVAHLQQSENLYRTIFENTGTATMIVEEDMTISLANTEFATLSGAPKQYWENKRKWTELFNSNDLPKMIHYHMQRRIDPEASPRNYQCGLIDKNGNKKIVLLAVAMIPDSKKSVISLTDITEQKRIEAVLQKREREVQKKSRNLEEMNTALKVLLKQREADKLELEEKVLSNIKRLVLPYLQKIKMNRSDARDLAFFNILEANLLDIISPFSHRLTSGHHNLTPKELQVANLIKEEKTTKEIAEMMAVSEATISLHRDHIRKKLGLNNKKINLTSYLLSLS